jgi:hypothetical protein
MKSERLPISEAPKDGTVIWTDEGLAKWRKTDSLNLIDPGFCLCDVDGNLIEDHEYGGCFYVNPKTFFV